MNFCQGLYKFVETVVDTDLYKIGIKFINENRTMNCIGENKKSVATNATTDLYRIIQKIIYVDMSDLHHAHIPDYPAVAV